MREHRDVIDTSKYTVLPLHSDAVAKRFILNHHYSGTYPAARFRYGLYNSDKSLEGVAVFSHPTNNKVFSIFGDTASQSVELGRLALLDSVKANGESFFISRCFEQLRVAGIKGIISFSDPVSRTDSTGKVVFQGHVGTIYQALNAVYLGRGTPRLLHILPDGSVFSPRTASKIRNMARGWKYGVKLLQWYGAPTFDGDPAEWLEKALAKLTRRLSHKGNHKYAWQLMPRRKWTLPASLPYPKQVDQ